MRRFKHTLLILEFYRSHFPEKTGLLQYHKMEKELKFRRIRISQSLAKKAVSFGYDGAMNDFLRDLSSEIPNRAALMIMYDLVDAVYKESNKQHNRIVKQQTQYRQKLVRDFKRLNKKRFEQIEEALSEESKLRKLPEDRHIAKTHCHLWKQYFEYSSMQEITKLIEMPETDFLLLMYQFAVDLALLAKDYQKLSYFDWKHFSYAGFSAEHINDIMDDRLKHLAFLGLDSGADLALIKKRFKELAKKHHPDQGGDPQKMRLLNIAYSCLVHEGEKSFG